jgi:hypothetical protein
MELNQDLVGDPGYIPAILNDLDNYYKKTEQSQVDALVSEPILHKLLVYSANFLGTHTISDDQREIFEHDLTTLAELEADKLEMLLMKTLDYTSYRLDAWLSSFAYEKLSNIRSRLETSKGLFLGAFGWVENLTPDRFHLGLEGGYIHSFSYAHTSAFALARDGYLHHLNDADKKDLLKLNLNSERTKNSMELLQALQNIPLAEFLGMKFERRLHDADLDYLIDDFRSVFPLQSDELPELADETDSSKERIVPRNLTNGLMIHDEWIRVKQLTHTELSQENSKWLRFWNQIDEIASPLNYLIEIMDGFSDLTMFESIFQIVNLNFDHSAAVLDGMSGEGRIPPLESPLIPITGPRLTRRIILPLIYESTNTHPLSPSDLPADWNPRKTAEPKLNNLLNDFFGDISFWFHEVDDDQVVLNTVEKTLDEVGIEPLDLINLHESHLVRHLIFYAKDELGFAKVGLDDLKKPNSEGIDKISYAEVRELIESMKLVISQSQPLRYKQLIAPYEDEFDYEIFEENFELFVRLYNSLHLVMNIAEELEIAKAAQDLDDKRTALKKAGFLDLSNLLPLTEEFNTINDPGELDEKIQKVLDDLSGRLERFLAKLFYKYPFNSIDISNFQSYRSIVTYIYPLLSNEGTLINWLETFIDRQLSTEDLEKEKRLISSDLIESILESFSSLLNTKEDKQFLVLPLFSPFFDNISSLGSSNSINKRGEKWFQKVAFVNRKAKNFDKIKDFCEIFDLTDFSFHYDENKFFSSSDQLLEAANENPLAILAIAPKRDNNDLRFPPNSENNKKLAGFIIEDFSEKIIQIEQETPVAFHHNSPNSEPAHSLIFGIPPKENFTWNKENVRTLLLKTLDLAKIRSVDYRSLGDFRNFIPLSVLNILGDDVFVKLLEPPSPTQLMIIPD